jgi:hypothetical protein
MTLRRTAVALCVGILLVGSIVPVFAVGGVAAEDREPNDSFSSAVTIAEGSFSGEIVSGESDFYKLDANSTDALRAEITSADTLSDIALRIYDSDRQQLVGDGNDFEGINGVVKLPENGTYYVEVVGQSSDTNSGYTLDVDVITPAENDQFAPNDGFESAAPLEEGFSEARIVGGESDFYRIEANTTDALRVDISSADTLNDLQLRLYNSNREQLVADGNDFEGINFNLKLPETGTYYVEVAGQSQQTTSNYTLDTDVITPTENDQFAPNDDFESAAPLEEGFSEARIVGGETDFYQIEANATDALSVDISSADTLNDLQLRLYNSNREQLVADGNDFEGINFNLKLPETGTYYVEVAGQSQQTTSEYTLNTDVITPAENDQFAPNDDFGSAAPISEGVSEARIVGGESDFYRLNATTDDAIQMDITQADTLSDVGIRLYDENRTQLVADGNDFEGIGYTLKAPTTGMYYVEIAGQSQQTTSEYTVATDIITPAENDQFAPNHDFESAAQLREEFTDARVVGGEADYYKLTLNESEQLGTELTSAASLSDLVIELYGPDQTRLAGDGNDFEGLTLTHQADQAGTYYIRVAGQSQQTTSTYRLRSNQTFTGASPVQIEDVSLTPQTVETNTTNEHTLAFSLTNVSADSVNDTVSIAVPEGLTLQQSGLTLTDQRANEFSVSDATPADGTVTITLNPQPETGPATRTLDGNATLTVATANATGTTTEEITITATDSENGDDTTSATLTVQGPGPGDLTGNGEPAQDLDGDGTFEDVNGDGQYTLSDVQALFAVQDEVEGQTGLDFNGDGQVTISDVQALFAGV